MNACLQIDTCPEPPAKRVVAPGMPPAPRKTASVSVVVPVYNSESILPRLLDRLEPVLASVGKEFEVVLVNDGSADASWETIQELAQIHPWVRGINLMRNY